MKPVDETPTHRPVIDPETTERDRIVSALTVALGGSSAIAEVTAAALVADGWVLRRADELISIEQDPPRAAVFDEHDQAAIGLAAISEASSTEEQP